MRNMNITQNVNGSTMIVLRKRKNLHDVHSEINFKSSSIKFHESMSEEESNDGLEQLLACDTVGI